MDQPERVRYFDQQFLRVDDFNAEQDYHRDMRRRHNRMLHTPGIADGLQLAADGTGVKISPGAAIAAGADANGGGAEIVLAEGRRQELSSFAPGADVYLAIRFEQEKAREKDDAGVKDYTRWRENPVIEAFPSDPTATPPADPSEPLRVLLGKVTRGGTGGKDVLAIDVSGRRLAGAAESELSLTPRLSTVQEPDWVRLRWVARGQAEMRGSLQIAPGGPTAGDLTVAGRLGVGTTTPQHSLVVTGNGLIGNVFMGDVGHSAAFAGFAHRDAIGPGSYGLLHSSDGRNTFLNKRSGGGRIEFRVDNSAKLAMDDAGNLTMGGDLTLNGRPAVRATDNFLRINPTGASPAGVLAPGLLSSGSLNVGGLGGFGNALPDGTLLVSNRVGVGVAAPQHALHVVGNAVANNVFVGDAGHSATWAAFCHRDAVGTLSYGLLHSNDGRNTFLNKRSGGGTIEFRVDNSPKLAMNDAGTLFCNGKDTIQSGDTFLRLNQSLQFTSGIHTPGLFSPASLNVGGVGGYGAGLPAGFAMIAGNLGIGTNSAPHRLTVAGGDILVDGGATLRSKGRLHLWSEELLYILARGGIWVTRDWGGSGEVHVSNSVYCNGYGPSDRTTGGEGLIAWDIEAKGGLYSPYKRFVIDHPLDPERRRLVHTCIEGPENGVYYRGESRLVDGRAYVRLPEYFEALTREEGRTLTLTQKLEPGKEIILLAGSAIRDGGFEVRAAAGAGGSEAFYWEVKAVRADVSELVVEVSKDEAVDAGSMRSVAT